ncbi:hypothetical protein Btru_075578 [Bulinus truncatus]|nr:hypothetical protein Btru_075578 [Bulinus truncatus]
MIESDPRSTFMAHEMDIEGLRDLKFGKTIKEKEFLLNPDVTFLNHGSYGAVPKRVMDMLIKYHFEREQHPDFWFRFNCKQYVDQSRQSVANFIKAEVDNVLLVSNVTTAINNVIRLFPFAAGDALLDTNLTFGSIGQFCEDFTARIRPDVERVNLKFNFPIKSEKEIIKKYEEIFRKHPNVKVAIIDHITGPTAILMPVKKLIELCHQNDVIAVIDGAHAIGHLDLDMEELGADVYTTNCYKWGFAPRGSAVLWFHNKHRGWIDPVHTAGKAGHSLDLQFFEKGTRDHIPLICVRHALEFIEALGGVDHINRYTSSLAEEVQELLQKEIGLQPLPTPQCLVAPSMRLIKLPRFVKYPCTEEGIVALRKAIFGGTNVFGVLILVNSDIYLRYSVQIYNDIQDFKHFIQIFNTFLRNNAKEIWLE